MTTRRERDRGIMPHLLLWPGALMPCAHHSQDEEVGKYGETGQKLWQCRGRKLRDRAYAEAQLLQGTCCIGTMDRGCREPGQGVLASQCRYVQLCRLTVLERTNLSTRPKRPLLQPTRREKRDTLLEALRRNRRIRGDDEVASLW